MDHCPTCGNPLSGEDPRFCYFCEKPVVPVQEVGAKNSVASEPSVSHNLLDKCPSCGKMFAGEVINKEEVDMSKTQDAYNWMGGATGGAAIEETWRYYYRCKHCSFEWTQERSKTLEL